MRRRLALLVMALVAAFALPLPAAQYMDCYPGKLMIDPNPDKTRCIIDFDNNCMICIVTITIEK